MESRNEQPRLMSICHKFLNSLSQNSAFRRLQHHIRNQSSDCDSKLMPAEHCKGNTMVVAKNAVTCDGNPGNEIVVEQGIHIVSQSDLYSEIEDEPYLVSHEEASSACHPVKEVLCNKDDELSGPMTLVNAGAANSATQFASHFEENGESHLKDEEAMGSSAINLHSSSLPADAPNDQSQNAGADSLTQLQNAAPRDTLRDDKGDKGSDSNKDTEATIRKKGHTATDSKLRRDGKQQTAKGAKPPRSMRRPSGQNERPSVLIKRRRTTRRAGLAMDSVLL